MAVPSGLRRVGEGVFFVALLLIFARSFTRAPSRSPADVGGAAAAASAPSPGAPGAAAVAEPLSSARPYVRRLVTEVPPLPGGKRDPAAAAAARSASTDPSFAGARLAASDPSSSFAAYGSGRRSFASVAEAPSVGPEPKPENGAPPASPAASDAGGLSMGKASSLVASARGLKGSPAAAAGGPLTPQAVARSLLAGIAEDFRLDGEARSALAKLGPGASLAARESAVARALRARGLSAEPEDVAAELARASAPPRPAPPQAAIAAAVNDIATHLPDPAAAADIQQHLDDKPPIPSGPPPKGAADAYAKYKDAFDRAYAQYGVKPQDILAILSVESSFGANTGNKPLVGVLVVRAENGSRQANSDLQALSVLAASGDLGPRQPSDIRSSYAGAYGPPQFLAKSHLDYGVSADGTNRDLFVMPNSIMSIANYLKMNGYGKSVAGSIFAYNHSQQYVDLVMGRSATYAPLVNNAPAQTPAPPSN
jgi:hypothetical protein